MYYKSVNRGLSFTKPGVYTFGLVLFVGLTAVATGINGLFVFLSVGLGGFIVSGLLSERAMKSCTVTGIAATMTDAGAPFDVTFTIVNRSTWFTVYSMRAMFMLRMPRFRLIARETPTIATVRLARVPPHSSQSFVAAAGGMPRGEYSQILAMQLTTFPFGILEKFKLTEVPASLIVAPAVDQAALAAARRDLARKLRIEDDREFFAHRSYMARDSLRLIDWKKSAARPSRDWVIKVYRTPSTGEEVRVEAPWSYVAGLRTEAAYEGYLSRVRTVLKVLEEAQRNYCLDLGEAGVFAGHDAALAALAALPAFADRAGGPKAGRGTADREVRGATLVVSEADFVWHARAGGDA